MNVSLVDFEKKEKSTVILAVTIGNLLEWYEIYLYVYWAPIIAKLFFNSGSALENLTHTYLIFAMGFWLVLWEGFFLAVSEIALAGERLSSSRL
jgi:hypothetical protein